MNLEHFFEHLKNAVEKYQMIVDKFGDIRTEKEYEIEKNCELELCPIRVVHRHLKGKNCINIHDEIYNIKLDKSTGQSIMAAADNKTGHDEIIRQRLEHFTMGEAT